MRASNKFLDQMVDLNKAISEVKELHPKMALDIEELKSGMGSLFKAIDALQSEQVGTQITAATWDMLDSVSASEGSTTKTNFTGGVGPEKSTTEEEK